VEEEDGGSENEGRYRVRDGGCCEGFGSAFVVGCVLDIFRWRFGDFEVLREEDNSLWTFRCQAWDFTRRPLLRNFK
jgi:hypothetical protein